MAPGDSAGCWHNLSWGDGTAVVLADPFTRPCFRVTSLLLWSSGQGGHSSTSVPCPSMWGWLPLCCWGNRAVLSWGCFPPAAHGEQRRGCTAAVARGRWLLPLSCQGLSLYKALLPPSRPHATGPLAKFAPRVARSSRNMGLGSPHGCTTPALGIPASAWVLGKLRQWGRRQLA